MKRLRRGGPNWSAVDSRHSGIIHYIRASRKNPKAATGRRTPQNWFERQYTATKQPKPEFFQTSTAILPLT